MYISMQWPSIVTENVSSLFKPSACNLVIIIITTIAITLKLSYVTFSYSVITRTFATKTAAGSLTV